MNLSEKFKNLKNINVDTLVHPYSLLSIALLIALTFFFLLKDFSAPSLTSNKILLAVGLYLIAIISTIPDRFKPLVSFTVGGGVIIMLAAAFGPIVGFILAEILQIIYIYIGMAYRPVFIVRTLTISALIMGVLPSYLNITPSNITMMVVYLLILNFLIALPFRIYMPGRPLFRAVSSRGFNIYWQYLLLSIYGEKIFSILIS